MEATQHSSTAALIGSATASTLARRGATELYGCVTLTDGTTVGTGLASARKGASNPGAWSVTSARVARSCQRVDERGIAAEAVRRLPGQRPEQHRLDLQGQRRVLLARRWKGV